MNGNLRFRIDKMYSRDCGMAWVSVLLLWVTIGFVYLAVDHFVSDSAVTGALAAGAVLVLIFNTASIAAMVRHYKEDKDHIYGLDIHHLDENRARRAEEEQLVRSAEARS